VEDSLMKKLVIAVVASLAAVATLPATPGLSLTPIGTLKTGPFRAEDPRAAEINAFDPVARRIFAINPLNGRLDIIDASDPAAPVAAGLVDIVAECQAAMGISCPVLPGSEPNSVAIHDDLMAIAVANAVRTDNGHAVFFSLNGLAAPQFVAAVEVGALPDMITFDEDGKFVLTANEGEPNPSYTIDPPGSVSVIEVARLGSPGAAVTIGFDRFDEPDARAKIEAEGVRIFGPGATVAQDLEPEYIAVRGNKAYVTLQENNALAIVNIAGGTVEKIVGLGLKDHALAGDALDASDQDGINIRNWPVAGCISQTRSSRCSRRGAPT
jgi:DNA-binding beta-propeller fold protein YncE